ncbi:GNAT family N-acetyltransferase [Clostridium chromiireducens]|uniref:GNAT family N-acetyltransferase n=1 Tax=Clostridium chromiireducens TaxID=225345 RepID=A0A1V4IJT9_9CLOT|nr:GNAT family N-acetyltransferase [Clostridium chromiireducens]OPJ60278.1 mycothiol acetyltransferase [Clostridium chromiireducens]RII34123.1 GNAT family N-acetyltransferase [Clostridium chromiireducens]
MEIIAYKMQYLGNVIVSNIDLVCYEDKYYESYKIVYEQCFYEMRKALELVPYNCCDSKDILDKKKSDIFLLVADDEIIGSVAIYGNEIDDLIVYKKYQGQGYGKKLLFFAISYMQKNKIEPIKLCVLKWNEKAVNLYEKYGFKCIKIEKVR